MKRNGKEFAEAPLWLRELHAYKAGRKRSRITLADHVNAEFSMLPLRGLVGLQLLGKIVLGENEDEASKTA